MRNIVQKIIRGNKETLKGVLAFALVPAMLNFGGCSNVRETSNKYIPLCNGGNLQYNNLEILAQAEDGQRLAKIDENLYIGEEECMINVKNLSRDAKRINYITEENKKILEIYDSEGIIMKYVWKEDGSFYQEIFVK